MTKKEFFEENYLNLLNQAKETLADMVKTIINKINEIKGYTDLSDNVYYYVGVKGHVLLFDGSDETHIILYEFGISTPIYREHPLNAEMTETISSAWVDSEGNVGFEVDAFGSGYDISMDDIDMDMVLYLIGEFENVDVNEIVPKKY